MKSRILIALFFSLLISSAMFAQEEIGKIFTKKEALKLYGKVTIEKVIPVSYLKEISSQSKHNISFSLENDQLTITGDTKTIRYPNTNYFKAPKVSYLFSKNMVAKFLQSGSKTASIKVQMRGNVLTLESEDAVLELSLQCPPYCPED